MLPQARPSRVQPALALPWQKGESMNQDPVRSAACAYLLAGAALISFISLPVTLGAQEAGAVLGGDFEVVSGEADVIVTCLGKSASFTHRLHLENTGRLICDSGDKGKKVNLGTFPAETILVFRLDVVQTGHSYFTGPASRNPDGVVHAKMTDAGKSGWHFGFEDLAGGGDQDFDDCLFLVSGVTVVPAPAPEMAPGSPIPHPVTLHHPPVPSVLTLDLSPISAQRTRLLPARGIINIGTDPC
jgi:hypothetical protein